MTGQVLGHYQLVEKLGEGGMGEVYKARDTRLNRFVAIKVLRREVTADERRKQRLVQEAHAVSSLNHPNIVVIHDFASEGGFDYIVMEYVAGKTLDALIPRQGMQLADVLRIGAQIADGLASAHAAGIVHRDLKPSNVIVGDDGRAKLLDFGLAKQIERAPSSESAPTLTRSPQTEEGTIVGTVAYMSPEQAEGRRVDSRSDIFSFGSMLYEMVSGRRPFASDSHLATLSAILKEDPQALEVSADISTIVRRCLRKDPARRFQHMADVKVALDEVRESSETAALSGARMARSRLQVSTGLWASGAVVVVATLAALAWWMTRHTTEPTTPQAAAVTFRRTPLTSYPGAEQWPTFSPDGRQVAFAWNGEERNNFDIYAKIVGGGDPLRLTTAPEDDRLPAWSPDGTSIAFARGDAIYTISPLGGTERKIADASVDTLAWTPDGKAIAFSDISAGSFPVTLLTLETGERRQLTHPPRDAFDSHIAFSPDGKRLAFVRMTARSGSGRLHVMNLPDGEPRAIELQNNFLYEVAWTADSRGVLASVEGGGGINLWRIDPDSGQTSQVAGIDAGARAPMVSGPSGRLAYSRTFSDENILTSTHGETKPVVLSTLRDFNPRLSPDGTRLAFVSDRTGGWEVFLGDNSGGRLVQLTSFGNVVADGIRWSPDGREITFAVLQAGNRDIYTLPVEGGSPRRLTSEPSDEGRPSYSMDGQSLYFRSNRSGREEIWRMPRQGGTPVQVTYDGGFEAVESLDGKTLYFIAARGEVGLWSMPVAGGSARRVPGLEAAPWGRWDITVDGVCYLADGQASLGTVGTRTERSGAERVVRPIQCWNANTGRSKEMAVVDKPVWTAVPVLSVSRDGTRFYWSQTDHRDADLVLVENFR